MQFYITPMIWPLNLWAKKVHWKSKSPSMHYCQDFLVSAAVPRLYIRTELATHLLPPHVCIIVTTTFQDYIGCDIETSTQIIPQCCCFFFFLRGDRYTINFWYELRPLVFLKIQIPKPCYGNFDLANLVNPSNLYS